MERKSRHDSCHPQRCSVTRLDVCVGAVNIMVGPDNANVGAVNINVGAVNVNVGDELLSWC